MNVHLSLKSSNEKTGPIPVSVTSGETCSDACPMKGSGCYAAHGPLSWHWKKVTTGARGGSWSEFLEQIRALPVGQPWRHNAAGDLPGLNNRIDAKALKALVSAQQGKRGWTYTHKPMTTEGNRKAVANANKAGFTINLSADSLAEADELAALGVGPVVVVVKSDAPPTQFTPEGRKVVVCPAQQREGVTCADCMLCQRRERSVVVGFRAHGINAHKLDASLSN